MSNDKQQKILQMAKDICRVKHICTDVCEPISACDALRYADRAVEAGYVKQKEGEWIVHRHPLLGDYDITCSCCGRRERSGPAWDISWGVSAFCPDCGARMKGGAE